MLQPLPKPTIMLATPEMARKRSLASLSEPESICSDLPSAKKSRKNSFLALPTLPNTPPDSIASSPAILPFDVSSSSPPHSPLPPISEPSLLDKPVQQLPSIQEFDQAIRKLIDRHGYAHQPPVAAISRVTAPLPVVSPQPLQMRTYSSNLHQSFPTGVYLYGTPGEFTPPQSPESEGRHINQKYTTEEGDYIIYAWHDKNLKWQRIKEEFAAMFGRTPERTVQGLQAWYYRMNKDIPVWDDDGWLVFENEDDIEPKCETVKRRQTFRKCQRCQSLDSKSDGGTGTLRRETDASGRDKWVHRSSRPRAGDAAKDVPCTCKPLGHLGLAQRYPERAIHYPWVDDELKRKAHDWAMKRTMQYRERRERRSRKDLRHCRLP